VTSVIVSFDDIETQMGWVTSPPNANEFVSSYVWKRYGVLNDDLLSAWNILGRTAYNSSTDVRLILLRQYAHLA